ncbi:hypothetical protein OAM77_03060 [Alphaproteobacteria bacterium]|jgi:hypothetical protein|nr:hypothetical protein [Alphaproteobacteria bacterium]MBT5799133.1 hypothetical protein [Alphaproteobacteria bacterium]MDA9815970.1 hypothetical protein [Alphaproteobacteria bacterium]MDC0394805.1 hypothetical protein [Alphaproteobacteria bacterium]MDC0461480.1 hypothetical protein [Alphaproteobacteria bacterium]
MIFRKLALTALSYAVRNPAVRKQAKKLAVSAAEQAKPALLSGSRVAGETYRSLKTELKTGVSNFKKEK